MIVHALNPATLEGLPLTRGRIKGITATGVITVKLDQSGETVDCFFLKTGFGPLPTLHLGAVVLCAIDEKNKNGYVLGLVQKYQPLIETDQPRVSHPHPDTPTGLAPTGLAPYRLNLSAEHEIVISCGESTLILQKDGKVILKGVTVTTRASETNAIKGASVKIN